MALELGPCQVLYGEEDNEEDLGVTQGGVVVHFSTDLFDLKDDQHGTAPVDQQIVGQTCRIDVPLAEVTLDNFALALNQVKKAKSGKYGVPGANIVGTSLKDNAKSLILKKYINGAPSSDSEDWFICRKAAPSGTFDLPYSISTQRTIMVVFTAFPDDNGNLYIMGDEEAAVEGS